MPSVTEPEYKDCDPNQFGLFRSFLDTPVYDPEDHVSIPSVCDAPTLAGVQADRSRWRLPFGLNNVTEAAGSYFAPFLNATVYRLMHWYYTGSHIKSLGELDRLVNDVILVDDFDKNDLENFSAAREAKRLDEWEDIREDSSFTAKDGWREASVKISVPSQGVKYQSEGHAHQFEVSGVFYRPLVDVLKSALQDPVAAAFNLIPYRLYWNSSAPGSASGPNTPPPERVYSEVYNSEAMLAEYEKIKQEHPPEANAPYAETVIAALMFWSDSTHLAQFGTASLWPIYLFLGNQRVLRV